MGSVNRIITAVAIMGAGFVVSSLCMRSFEGPAHSQDRRPWIMASMNEQVSGSAELPEEGAGTAGGQSAEIMLRAVDGSETTRRALVAEDEALYIGKSGILVIADGDASDVHGIIFSKDDLRSCRELYVDGERALVRRRFLIWDTLDPDGDYEREVLREGYERDLEEYERKVEEGDIRYVPNIGLYGFGGSSPVPSKPVDPTEPFYPRGLFTGMIIVGLLCLGIPALIELVALLLRP